MRSSKRAKRQEAEEGKKEGSEGQKEIRLVVPGLQITMTMQKSTCNILGCPVSHVY